MCGRKKFFKGFTNGEGEIFIVHTRGSSSRFACFVWACILQWHQQDTSNHFNIQMEDTFMWLQDSSNSHQHQQEYPRKTGEWKFSLPANYHKKWVAVEYLRCVSCGDCRIKLRLKYNAQKCVIQSNANCHSLLPIKKEIKIYQPVPQQIKRK